ncbi:hypothetical protein MTR_3g061085 [Medicago truncatula]|uniref:Uncharacterized protein n=1 Tax=Medicago truncatula TaxID=3880 RepID=A0A072V7F8_MEDTR|nr:hypothetical protein MTR_3g061085 [Medicago truncatula]
MSHVAFLCGGTTTKDVCHLSQLASESHLHLQQQQEKGMGLCFTKLIFQPILQIATLLLAEWNLATHYTVMQHAIEIKYEGC